MIKKSFVIFGLSACLLGETPYALADNDLKTSLLKGQPISTGARITPTAALGSIFEVLDP
ncbi:hypothetical protein MGMO_72c00060 [Methyloglobulus morosus KoM1]|uniref:Uncharacterized protein n=1 Tax=Methyloglobulus morosus KoM1 TaxID=1116472 RepID=V5BFN2_9GAMM|nr:hypothetical protein [Methyloglobulus morosus]ESS72085.1 hypothetical protein MGMO_72c00060 [Methyloglobulus morosus KoM1]